MTDSLAQALREQADAADLAPVDLAAVVRAGDRTLHRRRWTAAAAAVAAVVAGVALVVAVRPADESAPVLTRPGDGALTWARDGVLHTPSGDVDTGVDVDWFVATAAGFVVADGAELFAVADGETTPLGEVASDAIYLVGDRDGTLAAWRDGSAYHVVDLATGRRHELPATDRGAGVVGVDGRTLYVDEPGGTVAIDVDSGSRTPLVGDVVAVEDGRVATVDGAGGVLVDGRRLAPGRPWEVHGFSPDARRLVADVDSTYVIDVATGEPTRLDVADPLRSVVGWADADTLVVVEREDGRFRLVGCRAPDWRCEVVDPDLGAGSGLRLPGPG